MHRCVHACMHAYSFKYTQMCALYNVVCSLWCIRTAYFATIIWTNWPALIKCVYEGKKNCCNPFDESLFYWVRDWKVQYTVVVTRLSFIDLNIYTSTFVLFVGHFFFPCTLVEISRKKEHSFRCESRHSNHWKFRLIQIKTGLSKDEKWGKRNTRTRMTFIF